MNRMPALAAVAAGLIAGPLAGTASAPKHPVDDVPRNPSTVTAAAAAEAENHVGTKLVTTDALGNASWSLTATGAFAGERFTAVATNTGTLQTSEISAAVTAS